MDIGDKRHTETKEAIDSVKKYHKAWIGSYLLIGLSSLTIYFLLKARVFSNVEYISILTRLCLAVFFVCTILSIAKYAESLIVKYGHIKGVKYNLIRLVRILSILAIFIVIIAFLFENWYTAAVSLGLFSLILGFALQTPISSFIGWLYIIVRNPYKIGDRIQIGTFKGDVVEISYLDTTLWEFSGDYLTNDLPSGRLIRFPNTMVLQAEVYNYSWRKFPFIWNEIPFHVAYESDFNYVEDVLKNVTKDALGLGMDEKIKDLKAVIEQTPVDELTISEYPFVTLRISPNTWVEISVNYLVDPKKAASVRTSIIKNVVSALLQEPDRVMFPKSNNR